MQKTILITGCSSGIGYDAAHSLKKRGYRVFATCRQEADCARLRSEGLESFRLDYADEASIRTAVKETLSRTGGRLDALFNNGAYAIPGATEDLPRDALRAIFETNVFGQFELINQLLPAMKPAGRIINCSSVLGIAVLRMRGAYCASKFAMEALTDALRYENYNSELKFISIQPGPIPTKIRVNSIPHFEKWINWKESAQREVYEQKLLPRLYNDNNGPDRFELPCAAVTEKLVHALESPNPKPRYMVTKATYITEFMRRFLPKRILDRIYAGM
ncbi:MAG: SDR family NAD(P)-dependent oxidoreductase [Rhodobacteraceae bacterium]|nr:SDR family NAD(P)-dependent oxidoreductase [Paracoccaceae bacterium]